MAVFGPIPLQAGYTSMGELADLMMAKRKMQQEQYLEELKNAQRAKEAAAHEKYQQGMLGVSQSAESREQALQKYKLKKAQIENEVAQHFSKDYSGGGAGDTVPFQSSEAPPGPASTDTSMLDNMIQSGNPDQPSRVPGSAPYMGTPPDIVRQHPDLDYQQRVAQNQQKQQPLPLTSIVDSPFGPSQQQPGMAPGGQPPQAPPQVQLQQQPQQTPQQQSQSGPSGITPYEDREKRLNAGETVVTKGPSLGKNPRLNKYAGQTIMGIKVPKLETSDVDGIRYTTYPDESITAHKVGPSYEEKAQMNLQAAQNKEQAKVNIKQSNDLINEGSLVTKFASHVAAINDLLEKNKGVSGYKEAGKKFFGQGSKYAGEFSAHQVPLVGSLAKEMSKAGGAVVSRLAQASKPQLHQSYDYNTSLTNALMKDAYRGWKDLKQKYENLNPGKEYPEKLPKAFDKVKIKSPDGRTFIKSEDEAIKFKTEHPELEIEGNIYDEQ